jgi:hypothetical protein
MPPRRAVGLPKGECVGFQIDVALCGQACPWEFLPGSEYFVPLSVGRAFESPKASAYFLAKEAILIVILAGHF